MFYSLQGFLNKLRLHLLPRIVNMLGQERVSYPDKAYYAPTTSIDSDIRKPEDRVFLDKDRIYHHKQVWKLTISFVVIHLHNRLGVVQLHNVRRASRPGYHQLRHASPRRYAPIVRNLR